LLDAEAVGRTGEMQLFCDSDEIAEQS